MKYLRQEKNIALAQLDVLRAENIRLQTKAELLNKQLTEAREILNAERSRSDVSLVTAAKHDELLRKVCLVSDHALNILLFSCKVLHFVVMFHTQKNYFSME